jgi:hypothetical protein
MASSLCRTSSLHVDVDQTETGWGLEPAHFRQIVREAGRLLPLAPQVSQVGNSALVEREAVTLSLDHAIGFELADVRAAAIEVQRQGRRRYADGRGLGGSRSRDRLSDGRDGLGHQRHSCCVAVGYLTSALGGIADHARTCRWPTRSRMTRGGQGGGYPKKSFSKVISDQLRYAKLG